MSGAGALGVCFSIAAIGAAEDVALQTSADRVEITRGDLRLEFDPSGRGLFARASLAGREIGAASSSSGVFASLIVPERDDTTFAPISGMEIAGDVKVTSVEGKRAGGGVEVRIAGSVDFEGVGAADFLVTTTMPPQGPALSVSAELAAPEAVRNCWLASFGVAIPLGLAFHSTSKMGSEVDWSAAAAAILPRRGTLAPEVRYLVADQDETGVWGPMLWTLAGIRQATPQSMLIWEAWSERTPPFVLQYHERHPGWMAVADKDHVIAAAMARIAEIAPKEIYADSRAKVLRICFQSPYCRPQRLNLWGPRLAAGPAHVFLESKDRWTIERLWGRIDILPPTRCSFGSSSSYPDLKLRRDRKLVPDDSAFLSHDPATAEGPIAIWVDGLEAPCADPLPITRGVPLARGVLRDEAKASLETEAGRPIPCSTRALAFWPDGSTKWLLLDWQAMLQAEFTRFRLLLGDRARPVPFHRPLRILEAPDRIAVDTGKLELVLAKEGGKLALTIGLDLDGDGKIEESETIIPSSTDLLGCAFTHIDDPAQYRSGTWVDTGRPDPGVEELLELRVEERSPLRAVLLARADVKHRFLASTIPPEHRPPGGTPISLRFHVYADSSLVRLQHTFMFAGDVRHDFLRDLNVRLPASAKAWNVVQTGVHGEIWRFSNPDACRIVQESPDSAFFWTRSEGQERLLRAGGAAGGWLDVSGERWGVTVGIRHMREMFPQGISMGSDGIRAHFHPPEAPPMDVRRYAGKYGDGESTSTGFGSAFGALRTHEACWYFYPASAKAGEGQAQVEAVLNPPLARASPRYVADTLAAGHIAEHGAPTNDRHLDAVLYHMPRMHQHNREFWRWFGFWDFGDEIQVYDAGKQRWAKDDGRYGWYNNEPLRDYNYHLAYLMTGNRRIWEQAEAMSYHVFEVDVRHANPQPFMRAAARIEDQDYTHSTTQGIDLCGRRHNCQHWADGYFGPRIGSPAGFRLCYYQTGDPVMREYLTRLIASALATKRSQYMAADGDEAVLWAMIAGYEMTRDPKYLDRIRGYASLQIDFAKEHGGIPAAQANWDWATNAAGAPPADPREELWIWSFGGHVGLIEAAEVLGDPRLDEMLRAWTLAIEGEGPDKKRRESWSDNVAACALLAHYYRTTGDARSLGWCEKRLKSFHSGIPKDAPATDLALEAMGNRFPVYTPNDGYGWVYSISSFWYVGIPAWQGALRAHPPSR